MATRAKRKRACGIEGCTIHGAERTRKQEPMKILDAGWGRQGFFSLVSDENGHLFIHYNKQPDGYAVFQLTGMNEQKAQTINRHLADVLLEFEASKKTDNAGAGEQADKDRFAKFLAFRSLALMGGAADYEHAAQIAQEWNGVVYARIDSDQPCPAPQCNSKVGNAPIPQCVTAVYWAEEAEKKTGD